MIVAIDIPDIDKLPTSCRECPFAIWGEWHDHCAVTDKSVTEHIIDETKPDLCSMRDVGKLVQLVHDLYARPLSTFIRQTYEEEEFKSEVESLGVDLSDVHW